ncbi:alpha/beta fold hydrolase [Flavisolibacter nicotianae]|uniref:alpha/beta fold hydrolase n=1 Tax=Flavisolibacter nicotianae TaxID=2364882 RepID=UPI000EB41E49|nr:alpha/beta hydrolase [Flavisolibacter nicotianae]
MKTLLSCLLLLLLLTSASANERQFYFTTSDSVKLYVRIAGEGKPCLFVHGGPGSNSYYYEAMAGAPLIEQKMQMIYFDQRGSGRSDSARNCDYRLERMIKDMEEIRHYLGIRKWAVMGHSFGGILITNYALQHPASISALLYIHCTLNMQAAMTSHLEFGLKVLDMKDQSAFRNASLPLNERVWKVHEKLSKKDIWYKLMFRNAYEKKFNDSITFSAGKFNRDFATQCWSIPAYWKDYTPQTARIKCPVFVMTGDQDYAIGPDHYKSFRFPHQTVVHYIGGHAPFQEEPQWYAEKILAFLPSIR